MGGLMIFAVLLGIFLIGLFVWLMLVIFQEGPKPQDFTIVDNFMPQYTNNFSQGILLSVDIGSKRNGYTFVPKDIDYYGRKKQKNLAKIEPQLIYIDKAKAISFPRGTFSGERNRIWLLPTNPEDLSEELKTTKLGKVIMTMIDDINNASTEVESIREGSDRVRNIIKRMGDGEISDLELDRIDGIHDTLIKNMAKTDDNKPKIGSPSTNN